MSLDGFRNQSELLLRALPPVMEEGCFALKGGTAINLFLHDMPRLSVDIDLTYTPLGERTAALDAIDSSLRRAATGIARAVRGTQVEGRKDSGSGRYKSLLVRGSGALIKIEPNLVIRGTVFPLVERPLVKSAEDYFGLSVVARTLSTGDLYGGKICAALDRQHPRDLFDVKVLGVTEPIRKAFVVYMTSHDRPIHEILSPSRKDVRGSFERGFSEMTREPVSYSALVEARETLIRTVQSALTTDERRFLLALKSGEPEWSLLGINGIDQLPAIQWKLQNVRRMPRAKRQQQIEALRTVLGLA